VTSRSASSSATSNAACAATYEGEEGPNFVNDSGAGYLRSNLLTNLDGSSSQPGVPLALTLVVQDSKNNCAPLAGVQVDIWSCNATGVYSGEASERTASDNWLRGYQLTDASGRVTFNTIVPGWYSGRTTHIHLRLRSTYDSSASGGTNTTQLFFDQSIVNGIYTSVAPYASRGASPTTNAGDRVFAQEQHSTGVLSLTGSAASGFAATYTIDLPITAA